MTYFKDNLSLQLVIAYGSRKDYRWASDYNYRLQLIYASFYCSYSVFLFWLYGKSEFIVIV